MATMLATIALAPAARAQLVASVSAVKEFDAVLTLVSFDRESRTAVVLQGAGGIDLSFTVPSAVRDVRARQTGRTIRDANDAVVTVAIDDDDQGFDEIVTGDIVTVISTESIALEIVLPTEPERFGAAPVSN